MTTEGFRPLPNKPPTSVSGRVTFYGRMAVDFQVLTAYRDLRQHLPRFRGQVLDVGCGQSPYRFLLDKSTSYVGVDIVDADKFDYRNDAIVPFDGEHIPFSDDSFDAVICTEVLEHVAHFQGLVDEIYRVMKDGAEAVFTVPWSARNHYIPHDYFRYTPSSLTTIFARFRERSVRARGSDISVIGSKCVILWARNLRPSSTRKRLLLPLWLLTLPLLLIVVVVAHAALVFGAGSGDDPLGYTILVKK